MLRGILALLVVVLGWMLGKDALFDAVLAPDAATRLEAPGDWTAPASWLARPDTPPPGAWETPWGIDVILLLPAPRSLGREPNAIAQARSDLAGALSAIGPVYAPAIRAVAPASYRTGRTQGTYERALENARADALAAFEAYLAADNRGRGVMFVALAETSDLLPALAGRVADEPRLQARTVGFVRLSAPATQRPEPPTITACMSHLADACETVFTYEPDLPLQRFVLPNPPVRALPRPGAEIAPAEIEWLRQRALTASAVLDAEGIKPAPPLPPLESVDIAPVRRPGEITD